MPSCMQYIAGIMKSRPTSQYTLRNVPEPVDRRLRETAVRYGHSLNQAAIEAISRGLGMEQDLRLLHDLDDLAGTWVADPEFDRAMESMNRVDPELWQ